MLVDDHPIVRDGIRRLIDQEGDMIFVDGGGRADTAFRLVLRHPPDAVIVDISLEYGNGVELCRDIRARFPAMPILVLSMHDETLYAERVMRAGANGYVMKAESADTLVRAVRTVLDGRVYASERVTSRMLVEMMERSPRSRRFRNRGLAGLTGRELAVLELIGEGLSAGEIAKKLGVARKTIESHRLHIRHKLWLTDSFQLTQYAMKWLAERPRRTPDGSA